MAVKNQVQLITYPDSMGGDLKTLNNVLINYFKDVFKGGVHILPPYPSSGDRGFAPLTYLEIDPKFGTWEDILAIGENFDVILDLMVNHISQQSKYFQDFLENGMDSIYSDMFITLDKFWKNGKPNQDDINKIFLRRSKPYSTFKIKKTGEYINVWTTFGKEDPSEQIDLDVYSKQVQNMLANILEKFGKNNVSIVRLDAVGYVIKKLGTSCFFVEPEIYQFLEWIFNLANKYGVDVLPEVHADYKTQFKLAEKEYWVYDFVLPFSILSTLINQSSKNLIEYLKIRPNNQFTMLDCHDGIPVLPDLEGLIDIAEARHVVDACVERGATLSLIVSDEHKAEDGFDVHQICGTYYSLLDCNDDAYIAARAIQFFAPGIPQVYYVGLLAGENVPELVQITGDVREINRQNFSVNEIEEALEKDVVKRLIKLIKFRNDYPAFNGVFSILNAPNDQVKLKWEKDNYWCKLSIDLKNYQSIIEFIDSNNSVVKQKI